jgi:SMC interacting uncharacterized protein involved in chromosome segregation
MAGSGDALMNPKDLKDWLGILAPVIVWIAVGAFAWAKLTGKVNGLGRRVKVVEDSRSEDRGRMDRMERELADYRRDAQDAVNRLGRVERAVEDVAETVNQGNLQLGSQLHGIEKLIQEKDSKTRERLVRIETIAQIERKYGPFKENDD